MTLFIVPNGGSRSRFGVAATRKLGPAIERNRAKRLAREVFRRNKIAAGLDIVIVPRREMLDASFLSLEADYRDLLADGIGPVREATTAASRWSPSSRCCARIKC